MVKIHPTAIVHPSTELDNGVEIGPYTIIGEDVKIGGNTFIGPHCIIEFSEIGKSNNITGGAFIGTTPQDLKYHGEKTRLILGDNNIIREGVSIHRGTNATGITLIGNNCMFMAYSHVGHDCRIGNGVIMANTAELAGHVEIGDNAVLSAFTGIHQFARIGTYAMIGAGAMVSMDIPPFCTAQGDRAKLVGLNLIGIKRAGMTDETIQSIKKAYKILFHSRLRLEEALGRLKSSPLSPEVQILLDFCMTSTRGIARPR
ncbi:MAG TPA: acyl-ACP--UDP-N-acetylglucosamine O-acyltransferase [Candidatus Eremiobacteraeota bacterium]|nr:MAG: Acyl-(acyl-carrier-protein)--UDP-N-acetylglucosamine O-acyltransferase [bacterium ADurb.Bin363]HPZ09003.1 acyl-ACP--UDP-N-acetylglucosamine O-acyltransferase [Candidatus Eremiobacteraeota bacterium]